jgi:hypothetical protein
MKAYRYKIFYVGVVIECETASEALALVRAIAAKERANGK